MGMSSGDSSVGGSPDSCFEFGQGRGSDTYSTPEAFEKIREGLGEYRGLVLVSKLEVDGGMCGGQGIHEEYRNLFSLGILNGAPQIGEGMFKGIVLPMNGYIANVGCNNFEKKSDGLAFHCSDAQNVEIFTESSSYRSLKGSIGIYAGHEAVESQFANINIVDYYRAMNILGETVSSKCQMKYKDIIEKVEKARTDALKKIEGLIRANVGMGEKPGKDCRMKARGVAFGLNLEGHKIELISGVVADLSKYLAKD